MKLTLEHLGSGDFDLSSWLREFKFLFQLISSWFTQNSSFWFSRLLGSKKLISWHQIYMILIIFYHHHKHHNCSQHFPIVTIIIVIINTPTPILLYLPSPPSSAASSSSLSSQLPSTAIPSQHWYFSTIHCHQITSIYYTCVIRLGVL